MIVDCRSAHNSPSPGGSTILSREGFERELEVGGITLHKILDSVGWASPSPNLSLQGRGTLYKYVGAAICWSSD